MTKEGFHHYGHGKLLLTGEYFVLDGAEALAVPTQLGQQFKSYSLPHKQSLVHWKSLDHDSSCWFEGKFYLDGKYYPSHLSDESTGKRILEFLNSALDLAPQKMVGFAIEVETTLEFNKDWGLGSSSTLVASFAQWLKIDPFELLQRTFGGSGYDVACARADGPITYSNLVNPPEIKSVQLNWSFKDQFVFAYLGNKQDSREGIQRYKEFPAKQSILNQISALTHKVVQARDLTEFSALIDQHESIVAEQLQLDKVKDLYFSDFNGSIKSLGAWGGDFILAASEQPVDRTKNYFSSKGLTACLSWDELILDR